MLLAEKVPIGPRSTAGELYDALAALGGPLMVAALAGIAEGSLQPVPQPADGPTYAAKIDKAEARIDWARPAAELDRLVRGLSPFPGAWCEVGTERIKVLLAEPVDAAGAPGTVLDDAPTIACGDGALRLLRLQRAGKGVLDADALRRGFAWPVGDVLG
jgi:methionyl-tRNA formyltransferase